MKNYIYGYNVTKEDKIKWLKSFFKAYPRKKKIMFKEKTDEEISLLFYQYQSHCAIHNIKITT